MYTQTRYFSCECIAIGYRKTFYLINIYNIKYIDIISRFHDLHR